MLAARLVKRGGSDELLRASRHRYDHDPFFEYYRDRNYEYSAADLGFVGETDFRGRYRASEGLIFLASTRSSISNACPSASRVYGGIEGTQDEAELITEAQVFLTPKIFLKLNNAFGVTSKAPDWAPEVGLIFSFP